jgi:hypothetical protein
MERHGLGPPVADEVTGYTRRFVRLQSIIPAAPTRGDGLPLPTSRADASGRNRTTRLVRARYFTRQALDQFFRKQQLP